jgi:hypothetical protein
MRRDRYEREDGELDERMMNGGYSNDELNVPGNQTRGNDGE